MSEAGAFGASKAGAAADPMAYLRKPSVVFRIGALLLSVLMFAMISNQAWQPNMEGQEYCIINNSDAACQLPNTVAVIAFLASIGFLVGEYFFDQMSSVKSRKHFVLADLAFSGFWTAAYILSFLMMIYEWYQSGDPVSGFGQGSVRAAILCSFLSIYAWGGCALFSLKRYREGCEAAFTDVPGGEYQQSEPPFPDNQMQY